VVLGKKKGEMEKQENTAQTSLNVIILQARS
jgi:hypothetical protein